MIIHKNAFVIFALLVSGCTTKGNQHQQLVDACDLMPKSLAESVLQVKLEEPRSQSFGENPRQQVISNCQYVASADQPIASLVLTIRSGGLPDSSSGAAQGFIDTMKQNFGQRYELKKLSGLGDGAVWDSSLHQLTVFKGMNTYAWTSPNATMDGLEEKLVTLAKKTIPN